MRNMTMHVRFWSVSAVNRGSNRPFPEIKGEETEQCFLYSDRVVLPDGQDTLCPLSFAIHLKNGGGPTKSFLLAGQPWCNAQEH